MNRIVVGSVCAAGVIAGCGGGESEPAARTVTVVERVVTAPPPPPADAALSPSASTPPPAPPRPPAASSKITVPNVVGKNHQLAQDTMQSAGLYALTEEDATGQGRALLFDRNWVVVSQSPKPGVRVSEDRTITLRSKKIGE
jgi:PASTA domain-containing protein